MSSQVHTTCLQERRTCTGCGTRQYCLGQNLDAAGLQLLDNVKGTPRLLRRGESLFHAGDPCQALYVVRSGSLKTSLLSEDGDEHIMGFYGPGELLALEALTDGVLRCSAVALESASVCRIEFDALWKLCERVPGLQGTLLRGMSQEITRLEGMLQLARKPADCRIAAFLIQQSARQSRQGRSATAVTLAMSRTDIGRYLGLAIETVSRVLSRFQAQGLLSTERHVIRFHNLEALRSLTAESSDGASPSQSALTAA